MVDSGLMTRLAIRTPAKNINYYFAWLVENKGTCPPPQKKKELNLGKIFYHDQGHPLSGGPIDNPIETVKLTTPVPKTMALEFSSWISTPIYGWDCPSIYSGFEDVARVLRFGGVEVIHVLI